MLISEYKGLLGFILLDSLNNFLSSNSLKWFGDESFKEVIIKSKNKLALLIEPIFVDAISDIFL